MIWARVSTYGLLLNILSICSVTLRVSVCDIPGSKETVAKSTPVSSSGTSPVLVVAIVITNATIPKTTETPVTRRLLIIFSTDFLYFVLIFSYCVLNARWKRSMRLNFFFSSSLWGFKKTAHKAGESVKAFTADIMIDTAIVTPNSR